MQAVLFGCVIDGQKIVLLLKFDFFWPLKKAKENTAHIYTYM